MGRGSVEDEVLEEEEEEEDVDEEAALEAEATRGNARGTSLSLPLSARLPPSLSQLPPSHPPSLSHEPRPMRDTAQGACGDARRRRTAGERARRRGQRPAPAGRPGHVGTSSQARGAPITTPRLSDLLCPTALAPRRTLTSATRSAAAACGSCAWASSASSA